MAFVAPFYSFTRFGSIQPACHAVQTRRNRRVAPIACAAVEDTPSSNILPAPSVSLVSLGCPKNVTDAEVLLGDLSKQGIQIQNSPNSADADVVVINTCGFVEDAKRESIDAILSATRGKADGLTKGVVVTGCLAQRYADLLAEELPEVDAVVGFEHYDQLAERVRQIAAGKAHVQESRVAVGTSQVPFRAEHERFRLGPKHSVYVRLAEGCSHSCTFCAIPGQFRGKFRSKDWDSLTSEIQALTAGGAKELTLIAEDTNQYGMDFPPHESRRLSHLLHHIAVNVPTAKWIRLLYCYPSYFTDELIQAIANLNVVCKYIDMPLQHISDRVLRRMNRPGRAHTEKLIGRLRDGIPDLALRTSFICGFPGETEEDHRELVNFVRESRFTHAGFFPYSEEEGTPAATYEDQVPMEIRQNRCDELSSIQQQVQEEIAASRVGYVLDVIVDRVEDGHSIGRCRFDAPEVDGCVHILQKIDPGTILKVRILGNSSFDLYGEPVMPLT